MRREKVLIAFILISSFENVINVQGGEFIKWLNLNGKYPERISTASIFYDESLKRTETVLVGDMILSGEQYSLLYTNQSDKKILRDERWPDGIVPVKIDESLDDEYKKTIESAMRYIMEVSCIKFDTSIEKPQHFVNISAGTGCNSEVGFKTKKFQDLKLNPKYCTEGNIVHELLHTLGFYHMHAIADRDSFVKINYGNIQPNSRRNFKKYVIDVGMFNTQYDYR